MYVVLLLLLLLFWYLIKTQLYFLCAFIFLFSIFLLMFVAFAVIKSNGAVNSFGLFNMRSSYTNAIETADCLQHTKTSSQIACILEMILRNRSLF